MTIDQDIADIKSRNARVEADKAWETSTMRKICILIITYVVATCVMGAINVPQPYLNALIPTLGFYLSTLSLGFAKKYWIENFYNKEGK